MVHEQRAGGRGLGRGIEGAVEGGEGGGDVGVEGADFAGDVADEVGLVGREGGEGLRAFGVVDLGFRERFGEGWGLRERSGFTSLVPNSPYMVRDGLLAFVELGLEESRRERCVGQRNAGPEGLLLFSLAAVRFFA